MQNNDMKNAVPDYEALIRKYLGLDPLALASMDPMGLVASGLREFMRRTLERALGGLWAPEGTVFWLQAEETTKAFSTTGWPDAKTYNLSTLLAHSLLIAARRERGRPYIPLCIADAAKVDLLRHSCAPERGSMRGLVAMVVELLEVDMQAPGPGALQQASICWLTKKMLGIEPTNLVISCHEVKRNAEEAFARDCEGQTSAALARLVMKVLTTYQQVVWREDVDTVSLIIVDDERRTVQTDSHYSNIINLLVAALLADGERDVAFLV